MKQETVRCFSLCGSMEGARDPAVAHKEGGNRGGGNLGKIGNAIVRHGLNRFFQGRGSSFHNLELADVGHRVAEFVKEDARCPEFLPKTAERYEFGLFPVRIS